MRNISVDITKEKGMLKRHFSRCIGAGRAGEVMRHKAYEQLKKAKEECGFEYIRFHGLFHEEMAIVTRGEDGNLKFNFQYADILFDSLLQIGIRPIVELGLMPDILAKDKEYVFWWRMNKSMPQKIHEWYTLVYETVAHFTARYGVEEVKHWYFEVWNEPDIEPFFTEYDTIDSYFELYDNAVRAVKSVCSEYAVGGPATSGLHWIDEFVDHCRNKGVPVDFVSSHQYCVEGAFDADGKATTALLPAGFLSDTICDAGEKCKTLKLPLMLTEWSSSYSPRDYIHDSYFNAPFILETIKRCECSVDMMSYWVYSDIFEEVGPPDQPFHGGFGLMTVQSVPKASYHVFRFLNQLSDTELMCDDASTYVCRSGDEVQILVWNLVCPDMIAKTNTEVFATPIPPKPLPDVQVNICGLEAGHTYNVSVETVGYNCGDCYTAYTMGGFGNNLSMKDEEFLMEKSKPEMAEYQLVCDEGGVLSFCLPQTENRIDFIKINI